MATAPLAVSGQLALPADGTDGSTALVLSSRTISHGSQYSGGGAVWTAQPAADQSTWSVASQDGQGQSQSGTTNVYSFVAPSFQGDNRYRAAAQYSFYAQVMTGAYPSSLSVFA